MAAQFLQWLMVLRNPAEIWEENPTFLLTEFVYYAIALLTLRHALRKGGRYPYLWVAAMAHGLTTEWVSYVLPDIDNFWHSQTSVMLTGQRLPLYILLFYPGILYTAAVAVSKLKLPFWAEPFGMGLAEVILDLPYDILGIKFLWWTWHDTDPNLYDRHYWVPWTSYFFHMTFGSSFLFIFHNTHRLFGAGASKFQSAGFVRESLCVILSGLFAFPLACVQIILVYHSLHDGQGLHTEVCLLLLLGLYLVVVWTADRRPPEGARPTKKGGWFDELGLAVLLHYLFYMLLVLLVAHPENLRSTGLHEVIGNCSAVSPINTITGQVLYKKTYLCTSDYDEGYFDWHCLPGAAPPKAGESWYTICGTPYPNYSEYRVVVVAFCLAGLAFYWNLLARSGQEPSPLPPSSSSKPASKSSSRKSKLS